MEVRDPVHGSVHILDEEIPIIRDDFFQRLRNIKQLGFSEYVFPGATHSRFLHSIGVMNIGAKAFNRLFNDKLENKEFLRLKETFKLACLLHDIGHAPLSHSTEIVMPSVEELYIPDEFVTKDDTDRKRQATHEDYTIKAIADSNFARSFKMVEAKFGLTRKHIADLIVGETNDPNYFTLEGVNYFPLLHQLVSSELDCDRMDYLKRDSYFCGVSYGQYDLDWLLDNLDVCVIDNKAFLGISERAVVTFDDFLLSRYHMFIMVYFHYRSVCLEQLLYKYFMTSPEEYRIPADIEKYIEHDDHYLLKIMRSSSNKYAQSIVKNQIPPKIFESFNEEQMVKFKKIQAYLDEQNVDYIRCSSSSRLSKYYGEEAPKKDPDKYSMKVVRKQFGSNSLSYSEIDQVSDLFLKFSESHAVNRIHCDFDLLGSDVQKKIQELLNS
ncbi:MAG: HD domain-containing protein [Bacteriovoracaceae bacterium]|nr:HD domain-containing protein [Bacteriovoracaceae bacterium]